jgi:glycosyltransferase involved in cell wall biosynthesis
MRFIYADPGLVNKMGHHNTVCRNLGAELRARGYQVDVLGAVNMEAQLAGELGAAAHFRASPHFVTDGDPVCGWLSGFFLGADLAHADFARMEPVSPDDLIYLASGQAAHLFGLTRWLGGLPPDKRPTVVMDMVHPPGVDPAPDGGWLTRDPRIDAQAAFYRFTARQIDAHALTTLHFVCVVPDFARAFSELLGRPVAHIATLPFGLSAASAPRSTRKPTTVAVLGYQVEHKGYHLMPEVCARLLQAQPEIRIVVHNSKPAGMAETQDQLRRLAAANARLVLKEGPMDEAAYAATLAATDVLLCPYNPQYYRAALSGVVSEGLASGTPLVVPGGTEMADLVTRKGCGVAFEAFTPEAIARAVTRAFDGFDALAEAAAREAQRWAQQEGPPHYASAILKAAGR